MTVENVMDKLVTQLYQTHNEEQLKSLNNTQLMALLTKDEKHVLATRYWVFNVNVPVVVSVMRSVKQKIVPFWLTENGFVKTNMTMRNEKTTYEVWQKSFRAGDIGLGINGFDNNELHYFVSVKPQNERNSFVLNNFVPENQIIGVLDNGSATYPDRDELVLTDVPVVMTGQKLLTTISGRGIETHLVGAFRKTKYPSTSKPDQVMLTWSSVPSTSVDIQWRTDTTVSIGTVKYREIGSSEIYTTIAEMNKLEDRVLINDRFIHRFTAHLTGLKTGTKYEYQISQDTEWNKNQIFYTAANDDSFSFIWFGDTHAPKCRDIFNIAASAYPDAAFYSIAGDIVSAGLHRNQWDELFQISKNIISKRPLMCVLGNHDNPFGSGALFFRELFSYPTNAPEEIGKEQTYSFIYKNALFLMIDATSSINAQTEWIENQLKNTTATWKFAMFHFPPYNWEEPYFNIQKSWVPLFDKYHVDMVFGGHIHYYMRSKPMKDGEIVDSYNNGTAYIVSISVPSTTPNIKAEPYAKVQKGDGQFFQYIKINGNNLNYISADSEGNVTDTFSIKK